YITAFGFVADKRDVLKIVSTTDVGVLMSSAEGLPRSLGEFTCLGIPCWIAWLPQYDGYLDRQLVFREELPLVRSNMTRTLREILSHSSAELAEKGAPGVGYVGWLRQAEIVHKFIESDRAMAHNPGERISQHASSLT